MDFSNHSTQAAAHPNPSGALVGSALESSTPVEQQDDPMNTSPLSTQDAASGVDEASVGSGITLESSTPREQQGDSMHASPLSTAAHPNPSGALNEAPAGSGIALGSSTPVDQQSSPNNMSPLSASAASHPHRPGVLDETPTSSGDTAGSLFSFNIQRSGDTIMEDPAPNQPTPNDRTSQKRKANDPLTLDKRIRTVYKDERDLYEAMQEQSVVNMENQKTLVKILGYIENSRPGAGEFRMSEVSLNSSHRR